MESADENRGALLWGTDQPSGAVLSGAGRIFVVEPVEWKREQAEKLGASDVFADIGDAAGRIAEATDGRMCHKAIVALGRSAEHDLGAWLRLTAKGGTCVLTAVGGVVNTDIAPDLSLSELLQKNVQGSLFGGGNPHQDIAKCSASQLAAQVARALYKVGDLDLDDVVTGTYRLEQINEGLREVREHPDMRGIIRFTGADH
ncbi:zinc-binding dehydrogenase [Nocardia carnea]|uniref:zinc-binding dehydrogenase n=1 Tax=Nocardia carnea TaxID=37328 RepID=UPI0024590CB7|nr:zinc-binding dehydrogenase [Nocardia carnea]